MIQLRNIHFGYGSRLIFDGLNLNIEPGDRVGFLVLTDVERQPCVTS